LRLPDCLENKGLILTNSFTIEITIGKTIEVVAVLDIHIDKKPVIDITPKRILKISIIKKLEIMNKY
jgi:hypothetical protein